AQTIIGWIVVAERVPQDADERNFRRLMLLAAQALQLPEDGQQFRATSHRQAFKTKCRLSGDDGRGVSLSLKRLSRREELCDRRERQKKSEKNAGGSARAS